MSDLRSEVEEYLEHLRLEGRDETARGYATGLALFQSWCEERSLEPLRATSEDIRAFQRYLAQDHKGRYGKLLSKASQAQRLSAVKSFFDWAYRRGGTIANTAKGVKLPKVTQLAQVAKDHLSQQETIALIQSQAAAAGEYPRGSYLWAREMRALALLATAIATGRRRTGLLTLRVTDLDFKRKEIRCEREKGKAGRVLPCAGWAMDILRTYVKEARPVLNHWFDNDVLFVGERSPRLGVNTFHAVIDGAMQRTIADNPDLTDLTRKRITPHSLRVTFATILFANGCDIRTVNELMMHENLSQTAQYTPVPVEDLRKVARRAHPRG